MFELFTDEARGVIVRAQEWTREWRLPEIGTAGMLAALTGGEAREAGVALHRAGVTPLLVQDQVFGRGPGRDRPSSGHLPFSTRFKDAMARAVEVATSTTLRDDPRGEMAVDVESASAHDLPSFPGPAGARPSTPRRREILRPGHLLLALLDDPDCTAVTVLRSLGVDLGLLRASTRALLETWDGTPGRAGPDTSTWNPPQGRHRPAGTSRFPPPAAVGAEGWPFDPSARGPRGSGLAGGAGLSGGAAADAAWAALQRRQAGLPLWALRLWRGDMAIRDGEERAARRLTTRLPLSDADRRSLMRRHGQAVRDILDAELERRSRRSPVGRPSLSTRAIAAVARSPRTGATWAMRRRRWPLRGWITWLGNRWTDALARYLQFSHRA